MSENGSGDECLLERVKSIIIGEVGLPEDILLDEVC